MQCDRSQHSKSQVTSSRVQILLMISSANSCHVFVESNREGSVKVDDFASLEVVVPSSQNSRSPSAPNVPFFKVCPFSLRISSSVTPLSEKIYHQFSLRLNANFLDLPLPSDDLPLDVCSYSRGTLRAQSHGDTPASKSYVFEASYNVCK